MTPFLLYLLLTFGAGYSHYKGWKGLTLGCCSLLVWVSSVVRSAAFIAANYNTQSAPASFYTVT